MIPRRQRGRLRVAARPCRGLRGWPRSVASSIFSVGGTARLIAAETYVVIRRGAWSDAASMSGPGLLGASALTTASIWWAATTGRGSWIQCSAIVQRTRAQPTGPGRPVRRCINRAPGWERSTIGSRLYVVGGGWETSVAFNEQYDVRVDAWSRIGTPVVGQWRNVGLATLENMVYAVGGWSGGYLSTNEAYQALIRQLLPLGSG